MKRLNAASNWHINAIRKACSRRSTASSERCSALADRTLAFVYEPANLELCGQEYRQQTIRRLAPWIFNVYLQNQALKPDGKLTLSTWCRGPVPFDLIAIPQSGGIDFASVFEGLVTIGYRGPVTVHQAQNENEPVTESMRRTAGYLIELARRTGLDAAGHIH